MRNKIEEEYITITTEDDDEMFLIKKAIMSLTPVQRKIWIRYVENGTYSATAKEFGVSIPTIVKYLKKIQNKIIEYVFTNYN